MQFQDKKRRRNDGEAQAYFSEESETCPLEDRIPKVSEKQNHKVISFCGNTTIFFSIARLLKQTVVAHFHVIFLQLRK